MMDVNQTPGILSFPRLRMTGAVVTRERDRYGFQTPGPAIDIVMLATFFAALQLFYALFEARRWTVRESGYICIQSLEPHSLFLLC